ncbi:hypothetical protein GCM10010401_12250 [Rarobacter faecitabidus]|uniref:Uncharacterized protein with HEPN domain n=1 Tax=Rarobacter faecitabidus TaxID=13243 RepID=A0A542ZNZ7_RARFA|nr:HepT-like ribonuclease domain-containing protein [Rarobacter faecitabidus]TQL62037.1 uncharacterized protein with HEPN domain [Rarobacter faecitabidus]
METRVAKELLHIQHWLEISASIVAKGKEAYEADEVAQEAGDSLMIKIGEAAKTLAARGLEAPNSVNWSEAAKNREKLAHHYSITDRQVTWQTLSVSLPQWASALNPLFAQAAAALDLGTPSDGHTRPT